MKNDHAARAEENRPNVLPLSFSQQRLWFLDQLGPGSPLYNLPLVFRVVGPLNVRALEQALTEIVRRHELLRTTFEVRDGKPAQIVRQPFAVGIPVTDLSALPEAGREGEAARLLREEAGRPFDLASGPLLRAALLRLGSDEHLLSLTIHHIVSDGWSAGVLVGELCALYDAFAAGRPSPLPELPIQYADYAAWQREWLQGDVLERQLAYWKEQLGGAQPLELPTDRPRPAAQTFRGAVHRTQIRAELYDGLRALSRREGVTLFMSLLAAFEALLSRYTGQEDITVGTPVAGRTRAETEPLIGPFVNTLALRVDLSGDPTFRELLARVRGTVLVAYAHQDVPFEKLVEELQPERSLSRPPLFQVMLVMPNTPRAAPRMAGLKLSPVEADTGAARFDMTLTLVERDGGLSAQWEYSTDLFDAATVARMAGHFEALLEGAAANPSLRLSELPLLTPAERHQILYEFNDTRRAYGTTEATAYSTRGHAAQVGDDVPGIGRPAGNTRLHILDARMQPVPLGVRGEIYLGGAGLARGYLDRASSTAERFVPDPFSGEPGARLYRTGDLGRYLPDGRVEFLGRRDHQVKLRGYRIETGEIEAMLREHPGVREAVVVSRASATGDARLVAYVVADAEPVSVGDLRDHLRRCLPDYMIPAAFVFLETLPLTPAGKVDRRALPEPDDAAPAGADSHLAPRTEAERAVAEAWRRVLQVEGVGLDDNFFELGGHSLLFTRLGAELREVFGRDVPLADLFSRPTVREMAEYLSGEGAAEAAHRVRRPGGPEVGNE